MVIWGDGGGGGCRGVCGCEEYIFIKIEKASPPTPPLCFQVLVRGSARAVSRGGVGGGVRVLECVLLRWASNGCSRSSEQPNGCKLLKLRKERGRECVREREQMVARAQPAQPAQRKRERELMELKEQTCNDTMIRHASTVIQELFV